MPKRVYIVHGWDGYPEEGWFPWLKENLEAKGIEVLVPQLPDARYPRIQNWVPALAAAVTENGLDEDTYFIGHSMGCQTIARYLESLPDGKKIGGAVFVAGFFKRLTGFDDDPEVQAIAAHWFGTPVDLQKVQTHLPKSVAIFSNDDPWVPLDNQNDFHEKLRSEIVIEENMGHFSGARDKVFELPVVLEKFLAMASTAGE